MVTSLEDALEIVKLTDKTGLKFLVGETCRFYTSHIAVKKMYDDGDLGDLIFGEAHYVHDLREIIPLTPWRIEVPQDFMYGGCCHPVDALVWFFGGAEEVQAYGVKSGVNPTYPLEDTYLINIKFEGGKLARVLGAYGIVEPPMPMMGLNIYGTNGTAVADFHDFAPTHTRVVYDKIETKPVFKMDIPADMKGAYGQGDAVRRYMVNFEDCITKNTPSAIDAREGTKTIAILSAAWESIRSGGKPVKVLRDF
jgi:predicted dehydrogenase